MSCHSSTDNSFGPLLGSCHHEFDFTLLFEQSILSLVPTLLLLIFGPLRMLWLYTASTKTCSNPISYAKLFGSGLLVALQLAILVLWAAKHHLQTRLSVPAASLALVASLLFLALSYIEHTRSVCPSTLLNYYLLLSTLLDVAQARTLFLRKVGLIDCLFVTIMGVKLFLLFLEARNKRGSLKQPYHNLPIENTSGIFNRTLFWWINPLLLGAFRSRITFGDLPEIDITISSGPLGDVFERLWMQRSESKSRLTLFLVTNSALILPLLYIILPRIALIGFNFAQPFLINRVLTLLSENQTPATDWIGYGLIAATGFTYLGITICNLQFQHALYRYMTMFRGGLVTLIYRKTLSLRCDEYHESNSLTLMSSDIDRIVLSFQYVHEIWSRAIEVCIGITLLVLQLGWASIMPLILVVLAALGNALVAKMIGSRQRKWVEAIQRRVAITGSILGSMKSIKMTGLTETASTVIQDQRIRETELQASYRWMSVWLNLIAQMPSCLAPVAAFVAYILFHLDDGLDITKAFTVLSIITLTTGPAEYLISAVPATASCLGSYDRVQEFLRTPPQEDKRIGLERTEDLSFHETKGPSCSIIQKNGSKEGDIASLLQDSWALLVRNVTVRPVSGARPVIKNISFSVRKGSVLMIVGPVGAGKTTLVKAIMGELRCDRGDIYISPTRISYCSQNPWLSNCTIRQNICGEGGNFSQPSDMEWYRTVIQACALEADITRFPNGDKTIVGSKGVILSGGQKQRVALARALYSRYAVFILDDIFSALDPITQTAVFERILGENGIFRKLEATVILITHTIRFLPFSDQIIVLGADGRIAQSGTYSSLKQQDGFIRDLELDTKQNTNEKSLEEPYTPSRAISQSTNQVSPQPLSSDLVPGAEKMVVYGYYLRNVGWLKVIVSGGFAALAIFANSFSQVWLNWWVETGNNEVGQRIGIYALLGLVQIFFQGAFYWAILVVIAPSTGRKLHLALLKTVMKAPQSIFDRTETGTLLNRFSQDMTLMESQLSVAVLLTVYDGFKLIAQIGLIVSGSYYLATTLPMLLIVVYLLQKFYLRTSRQLQILDLEARSPIYSQFLETLEGIVTLRAFGWQQEMRDANIKHVDYSQRPYYLLYCIQRWLNLVLDLIVAAMAVLLVTLALNLRRTVDPGLLGVSLNNILDFNTTLQTFITGWTQLETSLSAVARVRHFEAATKSEDQPAETEKPPRHWPQCGSIAIHNLTAGYNPSIPTLRNVNLTILPGQTVGICGRTGSGKSTLLSTILRLIDPMSGDILVDDISLLTLPRNTIRTRLLTKSQDVVILPGSIRFNVDPMQQHPDSAIIQALERVQLWPDPLMSRAGNDGDSVTINPLNTPLHENSLSAGQVQLLALARVLLRKDQSRILLLDEATSSLDVDTEKRIWDIIQSEFRNHTIVHVAHRLDTLLASDLVVVMDKGEVVEVGKPGALLRGEEGNGAFVKLAGR